MILVSLSLVVSVALIPILVIMFRTLLDKLAERDLLVTFCPEGEIKAILSGRSFKRFIMSVDGMKITTEENEETTPSTDEQPGDSRKKWKIVPLTQNEQTEEEEKRKSLWQRAIRKFVPRGVFWIGLPPHRVFVYEFDWDRLITRDNQSIIETRKEFVDSTLFKYPYGIIAKDIEIKGAVKINITLTVDIEIENPYLATMILRGRWFRAIVEPRVFGAIVDAVRELTIEQFIRAAKTTSVQEDPKKLDKQDELKLIESIEKEKGSILASTGVKLVGVHFSHYDITDDAGVRVAVQKGEILRLEGEGRKAKAKAEAEAITTEGGARAEAIRMQKEAAGQFYGVQVTADAIRLHQGTLVLGGNSGLLVNDSVPRPETLDADDSEEEPPTDKPKNK